MSAPVDLFITVHLVLQFGFIGVTFLLMLMTVVNRVRARGVMMTLRRGGFAGLPPWPLAFLCAVVFFFGVAVVSGNDIPKTFFIGYLMGGGFWFISGLLAGSLLVSKYGLIHNINRADEAVAWGQILDYFVASTSGSERYVFFYVDALNERHRLEITIPSTRSERFAEIVRDRLDARFDLSMQRVYGKKALEG